MTNIIKDIDKARLFIDNAQAILEGVQRDICKAFEDGEPEDYMKVSLIGGEDMSDDIECILGSLTTIDDDLSQYTFKNDTGA